MEQLKRCPFCGGEAKLITNYETELVECTKCHCRTVIEVGDIYDEGFMDGTYVIPKWNTRKPMERILERLERLKNYEASGDCPKDGMCSKKPYECTSCYTTTAIEIIKEEMETNAD